MYTTCAFCNGKLDGDGGPSGLGVGRRLAFDAWKGRLWVICPTCSRWNLAPLEERWEKVEALARRATAQVALIRWQAYDLVQVGKPPRLELATWRYGERLKARRREQMKLDRKSTRLNSSHSQISYAVFCLKKKKTTETRIP